jgi:hypothetical protein
VGTNEAHSSWSVNFNSGVSPMVEVTVTSVVDNGASWTVHFDVWTNSNDWVNIDYALNDATGATEPGYPYNDAGNPYNINNTTQSFTVNVPDCGIKPLQLTIEARGVHKDGSAQTNLSHSGGGWGDAFGAAADKRRAPAKPRSTINPTLCNPQNHSRDNTPFDMVISGTGLTGVDQVDFHFQGANDAAITTSNIDVASDRRINLKVTVGNGAQVGLHSCVCSNSATGDSGELPDAFDVLP